MKQKIAMLGLLLALLIVPTVVAQGAVPERVESAFETIIAGILWVGQALAIVVATIAGIMYMLPGGEQDRRDKAKRAFMYAILGAVLMWLARDVIEWLAATI